MFDANTTITMGGLRVAGVGKVDVTVRWPTDAEWSQHRNGSKALMHQLGRGASELDTDTGEADAKLYEAIKLNGAPPLSVGEASYIIGVIGKCEVTGVELGADEAEVHLQIFSGRVKHTVRIPTLDEVRKLQRKVRYLTLPYGRQQVKTSLEAGAALWDACNGKAEGYAAEVPSLHKDVAIRQVVAEVEREMAPSHDEDNF